MTEEYDSEGLRKLSRQTAGKRVERYDRAAKAIAAHTREHGTLRREEFLASLKRLGEPSDHKIPDKLVHKAPT